MKKDIFRNIAIVTIIFMVVLSVMLVTNYFQVRGVTPLQMEVTETLRTLNEGNEENPELQEQIRQLDLLARKAYFVQKGHLKAGIYILLGMAAILAVCLRFYYEGVKSIPEKEIDVIDDWWVKSKSRKYMGWGVAGLALTALLFAFLSSPFYGSQQGKEQQEEMAQAEEASEEQSADALAQVEEETSAAASDTASATTVAADSAKVEDELPVSKITQNAFRGNTSNGSSTAKNIPTSWNLSSGQNILWKTNIPKKGYNSPVINGRNVFFSGADEKGRELYCYDINTGEQRWKLAATGIAGSPSSLPHVNDDTGWAAPTVATNGKQVCAIFATGDIICADMDGNKLWAKNLGVPDNHYGYASSLLVNGNTVIVQYDNNSAGKVMALNLANGNVVWSKARKEQATWSSPTMASIGGRNMLLLMGNPNIVALNPNNGEQLWAVDCMSGEVGASLCASNGIVFGASENAKMVAINGSTGEQLWESTEYLPEIASPTANKNLVYIATSYGVMAAFDVQTGQLVKDHDLGNQFYSSPMLVDGKLYVAGTDGKFYIFSTDKEFRLLQTVATGEKTFATPAFTDGKMVVRTNNSLYCVAKK